MLVSADGGGYDDDDKTLFTQIIINFNDVSNIRNFCFVFFCFEINVFYFSKPQI